MLAVLTFPFRFTQYQSFPQAVSLPAQLPEKHLPNKTIFLFLNHILNLSLSCFADWFKIFQNKINTFSFLNLNFAFGLYLHYTSFQDIFSLAFSVLLLSMCAMITHHTCMTALRDPTASYPSPCDFTGITNPVSYTSSNRVLHHYSSHCFFLLARITTPKG